MKSILTEGNNMKIAIEYYFDENKIEILTDEKPSENDENVLIALHKELNSYLPFFQEDFEIIFSVDDENIKYQYNGRDVFNYEYEVFDVESFMFCIEDLNFRLKWENTLLKLILLKNLMMKIQ